MNDPNSRVEADRQLLVAARQKGMGATLGAYLKLSGPGWLQGAITLGGGSLGSSLYLGVLGGYGLLWVQPFAMLLGIIMLSAIGYVTLSTGKPPFRAINEHVSPVLGWGWALAVAAANVVWCLPQYALANGVLSQNLLPKLLGEDGWIRQRATVALGSESYWSAHCDELVVTVAIFLIAVAVTWCYDRGGWGIRLYETLLKIVVAMIVACFFGVVIVLSLSDQNPLDWSRILSGFKPDFGKFFRPADTFLPLLDAVGSAGNGAREYWSAVIVDQQRDVIISAAATAVGINMTFLFAYSLLRKGWGKEFRGLVKFDLATGMLIPFLLATSCVVIAAASQFHTKPGEGFEFADNGEVTVPENFTSSYESLIRGRDEARVEVDANADLKADITLAEQKLAASLVKRDAFQLAQSLQPVAGNFFANFVFGFGVLAMTLSTITILMLISGFVFCELLGLPPGGWPHRIGTLIAGIGGALGPFIWKQAAFYLVVPTSVFGFVLLPVAYLTFWLLINQKSLLGDNAPSGFRRLSWNLFLSMSAGVATVGSIYMVWVKANVLGIAAVTLFVLLAVMVHVNRVNTKKYDELAEQGSSPP